MALIKFDSILKKEVITQDAYILGEVMDLRYDIRTWSITGLSIKTNSESAEQINVGTSKSRLLLAPGDYVVNQVVLTDSDINSARSKITMDSESNFSVSKLENLKIYSSDNQLIGETDSIEIDIVNWTVSSFIVKLDKTAYPVLEVKKGLLFGKKVGGILASHISTVAEEKIILSINIDEIKNNIVVL